MFSLLTIFALTLSGAVSGKYLRGPGQNKSMSTALVVAPSHALVEYKKYKYGLYMPDSTKKYTNSSYIKSNRSEL
jgi:hypothetical protein